MTQVYNQADSQTSLDQVRSKLTQVFRYVQSFNQLQNPIQQNIEAQSWTMWFHDFPNHPCIRLGTRVDQGNISSTTPTKERVENDNDFVLKVKRPKIAPCPEPPEEIASFLQNNWQQPDKEIVSVEFLEEADIAGNTKRQRLFDNWIMQRATWIEQEKLNREVLEIYKHLYDMSARLKREGDRIELVVGDGIISWYPKTTSGIHHPVLLARLNLHFDPQVPEFTLTETEHIPELYTALFQTLSEVSAKDIALSRQDFEQGEWHPLDGDSTSSFLQRLVNQLSSKGRFSEKVVSQQDKSIPLITRDPVLFLRERTLGFNTAIEAILEAIQTSPSLPDSVRSLVMSNTSIYKQESDSDASIYSPNGEDEHILLSKIANAEQLEIARHLERRGSVVVQGPPGTGKTHTIANILGHLLAEGKSVLVTSHTSKALKVLREKVVKPLQPLCVSVLEDDNRKQLENAIDAIIEQLSRANSNQLERDSATLTRQRLAILNQLQQARTQLKEARNSEYEPIIVAGQRYTPSEAARFVAKHQETLNWIPAPITPGAPIPLSYDELLHLYQTNVTVPMKDEKELLLGLPSIETLLVPATFAQLSEERSRLLKEDLLYRKNIWIRRSKFISAETLVILQHRILQAGEVLEDVKRWRLEAIMAGREEGSHRKAWEELIVKIEHVCALASQNYARCLEYNPVIPDEYRKNSLQKLLTLSGELIKHLEQGGRINTITLFLHKDWKTYIEKTRVKGYTPETLEHFQALHGQMELILARENLVDRWERQMAVLDGPSAVTLGLEPEPLCMPFVYQLRQCLDWYTTIWKPLKDDLIEYGLLWEKLLIEMPTDMTQYSDILGIREIVRTQLSSIINAEFNRHLYEVNETTLSEFRNTLQAIINSSTRTEVVQKLCDAVTSYNPQTYQEAYARLAELHNNHKELRYRSTFLEKLDLNAPEWAVAIRRRDGIHGKQELPNNPEAAWLWRQLSDELDRRANLSLKDLQDHITQLSSALRSITTELVEKKAWVGRVRRTTEEQRRALQEWKEFTRKIGKGTGKRAARMRTEARKRMPMCQAAVPVWIMPLNRVVQNFDPRHNHFDVVIIDEASQADIKALVALYMGQQVIVVGDHEQVTPLAIGQKVEDIERLIDEHLQDIPSAKIYDGKLSIYDLAKIAYGMPICLQEHFRCVSPIIQFSNNLSYQGKIKPLRDDSEVRYTPPTVAYAVKASQLKGYCNEEEAQTIASLLVAMTEQSVYRDASFGVISMVKEEQAIYIDTLLRKYLTETEYTRREILCGSPAQFQGDERDVILLSMVDIADSNGPLTLRSEDGYDYMYKKRFNVAASRARDQMWVVHSLDPNTNLKDGDIRKRLILHAENPTAFAVELAEQEHKVESEFEKQVLRILMQAGYRVFPQWHVGAYRIDLVVEGNGKRLAVECDGDRWHSIEKLAEDMARQAILERLGWRFERIRGSQFFRNPNKAMEAVFARLSELEILPEGNRIITSPSVQDTSLKDKIIRRAVEIRQGWDIVI